MTEEELNQARHELERERFEFEKGRVRQEGSFFNKNFATLITGAISVAALSISISQVWVANIQKNRELRRQDHELTLEKERNEEQSKLERERDDRKWNYESLQFVADHRDVIFGKDELQQSRICQVMFVTFPKPILAELFPGISAESQNPRVWIKAQGTVEAGILGSSNAPQMDLPKDILTRDELARQLNGPNRRSISDALVSSYSQNKSGVLAALISAILPEIDKNSYRNNLYIAVTLARLPGGWEGYSADLDRLKGQTRNYQDPTFRKWVDAAVQNHKGS